MRRNQYPKMEKSGYAGDKEDVNMKLEKEALQLINACLQVDFFRESTIPELKEALPEMADSIYEVAEKMDEFFELIEKKITEIADKQAEEFTNG